MRQLNFILLTAKKKLCLALGKGLAQTALKLAA